MDDATDPFDPALALASVQEARAALGSRLEQGSWRYDLTYSLLAGLAVGAQALPLPFNIVGSLTGATALALLARDYARRTGVWVCGSTPRRARWASVGLGLTIGLLCVVTFLSAERGQGWAGLPAAGVAMAAALISSRLWRRLYQRDLLDSRPTPPRPYGLMLALGLVAGASSGGLYLIHADPAFIGMMLGIGASMSGLSGYFLWRRSGGAAR